MKPAFTCQANSNKEIWVIKILINFMALFSLPPPNNTKARREIYNPMRTITLINCKDNLV